MVGQVLGAVGALPEIFTELEISYFLLRRLLGVRTEGDKKAAKVSSASWEKVCFTASLNGRRPLVNRLPVCPAGPETVQKRGSDGEHRLAVNRWARQRRQGRSGQDRPHQPRVHGGGGEDRSESACGETLAVRGSLGNIFQSSLL